MKKKYILVLLIINFSFGQAAKQEKTIRASMVYGYISGIELKLESISQLNPQFRNKVNHLNLLLSTNFGQSKKNAFKYLNNLNYLSEQMDSKIDSLKEIIYLNTLSNTNEDLEFYLKGLEKDLKGNIPSPMLENVLSFQYLNQPSREFLNGYTYTFSTKSHKKSKNTEIILTIPKSWYSEEGKQPNIIQKFTSDCGGGESNIFIQTFEMPFPSEEIVDLTFEEINKIYKEDVFTEEFAKKFLEADDVISYEQINIAGRAGFLIVFEKNIESMRKKVKTRFYNYIFHDVTYLHLISCNIHQLKSTENLEENSKKYEPLFSLIVNSIVVPYENSDIIYMKGTNNQKIIDVQIDNKTYDFILDTGATISLINKEIINKLLENGIITMQNYLGKDFVKTADGKNHLVEFWNVPNIIIGGKKINNVDFTVIDGENINPLLGMDILNKLNIYKIDLENYKIHLKKKID